MKISKRLETVANFVPKGSVVADIGSDHAYLPIFLVEKQQVEKVIVGEVVEGPFQSARENVLQSGLSNFIDVRLGNGLSVVKQSDHINCVTVCGMGGELISSILEDGKKQHQLDSVDYLILQPNVAEPLVRKWLMDNCYEIIAEEIILENNKIYEIIVAKKSEKLLQYSDEELQFGIFLPRLKNAAFIKKWQSEIEKYDKVIRSLHCSKDEQTQTIKKFKMKQEHIRKVISHEN